MSRSPRIAYPNAVYYLTSRGEGASNIFLSDEDRHEFLRLLESVVTRYGWVCHAYCLMNNHYHLIAETPRPNLSLGMRQLNGVYTQGFNRRHGRAGRVFHGRFKGIVIQKGRPLLELCRYVVWNPVRAGAVARPEEYAWSSARATAGAAPEPVFLTTGWLLGQVGADPAGARAAYSRFVLEGREDRPWARMAGANCFGDSAFAAQAKAAVFSNGKKPAKGFARPSLARVLAEPDGLRRAYQQHGYRLKEMAKFLKVHESTVSRRLAAIEGAP